MIIAISVMLAAAPYMARRAGLNNSLEQRDEMKGKPAPEFALESLDGATVHLSDFRGKAVLLNFWATWCQPCKIEMPWFEALQKQYGPQGFQVLGIAVDDASKENIEKFAKDIAGNFPILLGKEAVETGNGGGRFWLYSFFIDGA